MTTANNLIKPILLLNILIVLVTSCFGQEKIINVESGNLAKILTINDMSNITSLVLTGSLNSQDFDVFKNMPKLERLDLKKIEIKKYKSNEDNHLPSGAFYFNSRIKEIILPQETNSIGISSFAYCSGLKSIIIPQSVNIINKSAFVGFAGEIHVDPLNSNYTSDNGILFNKDKTILIKYPTTLAGKYTLPNDVEVIEDYAFKFCSNITEVILPQRIKTIGQFAFSGCFNLKSINIPENIADIKSGAFDQCSSLEKIEFPLYFSVIESGIFKNCGIKSFTISNRISEIKRSAFMGSSIINVVIPKQVKTIGTLSFSACPNLEKVIIQSENIEIKDNAFSFNNKLVEIHLFSKHPDQIKISENILYSINKSKCKIFVPNGSKKEYELADQWKDFEIIENK